MDHQLLQDHGEISPFYLSLCASSTIPSTMDTSLPPASYRYIATYATGYSAPPVSMPVAVDPMATLLTRSCITLTFGRLQTQAYLSNLLGTSPQSIASMGVSFGSGSNAGAYLVVRGATACIVDYDAAWIRGAGSLVPQTLWRPASDLDKVRLVDDAALKLPIWFDVIAGGVGISVADAVDGNRSELCDKDRQVSMNNRATTTIRILTQGKQGHKQIHVRDDTSAKAPITRERLLRQVGLAVEKIYTTLNLFSGPNDRHSLLILGIVHVSAGCWQPLLFQVAPSRAPWYAQHDTQTFPLPAYSA
ncbi:hypothetical protein PENSPDRAFT_683910 [Peniophora sp. CONT]|nr:hypothetical protein PENSPDRAFT_683910 [Peniophora sp. CONT]